LGKNILDRGFNFNIELCRAPGLCLRRRNGLIASLEGFAGRPRPRRRFPHRKGCGQADNINNVETWCNIAPIVSRGPAWFAETGSVKSPGTKVFSLVGKIQNTGLVEMPLGTPLKSFIYDIGEGAVAGRRVKLCKPADLPALHSRGDARYPGGLREPGADCSIMGSGGMVVMDEDNCMVDWLATSLSSPTPSPAANACRAVG